MLILVTGGAGYIGSHVVQRLCADKHDVVVFDNLSTGRAESVLGGRLIEGDLADHEALKSVFTEYAFDAVMHFAASTVVSSSVQEPLAYYRNNVCNTINLLEACNRSGVGRYIFSSTGSIYGENAESPISESTMPEPINPYGASKMMSERIITDYAEASGMHYVNIRYFNVAGADPNGRIGACKEPPTLLIPLVLRAVLGLSAGVTIYGEDYPTPDGTCIRDYIHVEDIAQAHLDALRYLTAEGRSITLNCGYGRGHSVREVIDTVRSVTGVDFPVSVGPRRPGDPSKIVADSTLIRKTFGWTPKYDDLETIVRHAYQWDQKHLANAPAIPSA